jgi:hypothetical protein
MTLRAPAPHAHSHRGDALDYEIAREQAAALGRLGRALERALAALSEFDRCQGEPAKDGSAPCPVSRNGARTRLVQEASNALWYFIVQREACGLRDPRPVLRAYRVPAEVHNRMGTCGSRISRK